MRVQLFEREAPEWLLPDPPGSVRVRVFEKTAVDSMEDPLLAITTAIGRGDDVSNTQ